MSEKFQTSTEVKMQVDSKPYQAVRQRSLEHEHWKVVTGQSRQNTPENLNTSNSTGTFHKRYDVLKLE